MSYSPALIPSLLSAVSHVIDANAEAVTVLDQTIGDGDHVTNLQRGLAALTGLADSVASLDWSSALQKMGMSIMSTVGGASGSLYATLFLAMSKALKGREVDSAAWADAFAQGVEAVKQRGKSDLGEKTMLDTLIPAAAALQRGTAEGLALPALLDALDAAAAAGAESTRNMLPTKGRASFLGERARDCLDPGAKTSQLMLAAIAQVLRDAPC